MIAEARRRRSVKAVALLLIFEVNRRIIAEVDRRRMRTVLGGRKRKTGAVIVADGIPTAPRGADKTSLP